MVFYLNFRQLPGHLQSSQHNCGSRVEDCRVEINRTVSIYVRDDTVEATRLLASYQIHMGEDTRTDRNVRIPQMMPPTPEPSFRDWLEFQVQRFTQKDLSTQITIVLVVLVLLYFVFSK
ncbi:hypothetical protein MKX01_030748 [Papaver californicum]|nr:hypothetical protein MKX01_030748 [Papaver californicum]